MKYSYKLLLEVLDIINYFSQIVLPWITWNKLHIYEEFTQRLNSICTLWSLFESNKMANKSEAKVYCRTSNHVFFLTMLSVHVYNFWIPRNHYGWNDHWQAFVSPQREKNNFSWKNVSKPTLNLSIKTWRLVKFSSR